MAANTWPFLPHANSDGAGPAFGHYGVLVDAQSFARIDMARRWIGLCLFGLTALLPQRAAMAEEPKADPRGAVLCAWMIYTSIQAIGENCNPKQDRDFLDFLQSQIDRMNGFIVRNSDTTQATLDERQHQIRVREAESGIASCQEGEKITLYTSLKSASRAQIVAEMDKMLEVDREPLGNPCL